MSGGQLPGRRPCSGTGTLGLEGVLLLQGFSQRTRPDKWRVTGVVGLVLLACPVGICVDAWDAVVTAPSRAPSPPVRSSVALCCERETRKHGQ